MAEKMPLTWETLPSEGFEVEVTAEDIADAVPGDAWACPVARAMGRLTGQADWSFDREVLERADWGPCFRVPRSVTERANDYDDTLAMEPFRFMLTPESWTEHYEGF